MATETMTIEHKSGRNWEQLYATTHPDEIYRSISGDLTRKYLLGSTSIRYILYKSNYDGTAAVTVDYGNGTRRVYVITI